MLDLSFYKAYHSKILYYFPCPRRVSPLEYVPDTWGTRMSYTSVFKLFLMGAYDDPDLLADAKAKSKLRTKLLVA